MKTIIITPPTNLKDETVICNILFSYGLQLLHLRKPGAERIVYEKFIQHIEPCYRNRIVIHDHYELADDYLLHGIHLKSTEAERYIQYSNKIVSISCHNTKEIQNLPFKPAYCFLSPIFDSISKEGYNSHFDTLPDLSNIDVPVIALGGITPEKIDTCRIAGFKGVAVIGYIWKKPAEALARFKHLKTPFTMSIAGFDPSSGAGVTADIKTFEATGSYGLGICTGVTFQNENTFCGTHWMEVNEIQTQCELQFQCHRPQYVKIGLLKSPETLEQLVAFLSIALPDCKIIYDPILKASAGYIFHDWDINKLSSVLEKLYLITPNTEELQRLFGKEVNETELQNFCRTHQLNLLWKGGHNEGPCSSDCLITPENIYHFSVQRSTYSKHGTGCILSAAITSFLAQGHTLPDACNKAQLYIDSVINSNDSKLGFHNLIQTINFDPHCPFELNLQYITAPKEGMSLCEQVETVCRGGMRWIQLRMKGADITEFLQEGLKIKEICHRYNALFIINDNVEVARQLQADGVHLGKEDMNPLKARAILGEGKIIGATCNTYEDVLLRHKQQVDYIGLGPFTFTTTKEKLSPILGLYGYQQILNQMKEDKIQIPVFAIGGIQETDILTLMQTGIQGIALSGLIKNSADLAQKTTEILNLLNSASNHNLNQNEIFKNCR